MRGKKKKKVRDLKASSEDGSIPEDSTPNKADDTLEGPRMSAKLE